MCMLPKMLDEIVQSKIHYDWQFIPGIDGLYLVETARVSQCMSAILLGKNRNF